MPFDSAIHLLSETVIKMSDPYTINIDNSSNAYLYRKFYQHPFLEVLSPVLSPRLFIVGKNNYTTRFDSSFSTKKHPQKVSTSYV